MKRCLRFDSFFLGLLFMMSCANSDTPRCELLPDAGLCNAAIPKFYFDQETQECKEFIWGGCNGVVPFDTLVECQECE